MGTRHHFKGPRRFEVLQKTEGWRGSHCNLEPGLKIQLVGTQSLQVEVLEPGEPPLAGMHGAHAQGNDLGHQSRDCLACHASAVALCLVYISSLYATIQDVISGDKLR